MRYLITTALSSSWQPFLKMFFIFFQQITISMNKIVSLRKFVITADTIWAKDVDNYLFNNLLQIFLLYPLTLHVWKTHTQYFLLGISVKIVCPLTRAHIIQSTALKIKLHAQWELTYIFKCSHVRLMHVCKCPHVFWYFMLITLSLMFLFYVSSRAV